ncbi:MAG: NAD-dependent deacylase [Acetobacteraceae bacterium]|nr:NAD-dependent deacylase [Acetobacteraceae bacterium]
MAGLIAGARAVVVFTGAGASTESGLPDFRSPQGLWRGFDPFQVASIWALRRDPGAFFAFYRERLSRLGGARPNAAHRALARLEALGRLRAVVTQNVDGLHQAAGSRRVIELHGNLRQASCLGCPRLFPISVLEYQLQRPSGPGELPACPACGGVLRPNVVLFGEPLPEAALREAAREASGCDLFLVVGSSLQVWPAAGLPLQALASGARLAIVNQEPTPLDGAACLVVRGQAGEVLEEAVAEVEGLPSRGQGRGPEGLGGGSGGLGGGGVGGSRGGR